MTKAATATSASKNAAATVTLVEAVLCQRVFFNLFEIPLILNTNMWAGLS